MEIPIIRLEQWISEVYLPDKLLYINLCCPGYDNKLQYMDTIYREVISPCIDICPFFKQYYGSFTKPLRYLLELSEDIAFKINMCIHIYDTCAETVDMCEIDDIIYTIRLDRNQSYFLSHYNYILYAFNKAPVQVHYIEIEHTPYLYLYEIVHTLQYDLFPILFQIVYTCYVMEKNHLYHNTLTPINIMIVRTNPIRYIFTIHDIQYSFVSEYKVIIDKFKTSFYKNTNPFIPNDSPSRITTELCKNNIKYTNLKHTVDVQSNAYKFCDVIHTIDNQLVEIIHPQNRPRLNHNVKHFMYHLILKLYRYPENPTIELLTLSKLEDTALFDGIIGYIPNSTIECAPVYIIYKSPEHICTLPVFTTRLPTIPRSKSIVFNPILTKVKKLPPVDKIRIRSLPNL